jgi:hypothetical protein
VAGRGARPPPYPSSVHEADIVCRRDPCGWIESRASNERDIGRVAAARDRAGHGPHRGDDTRTRQQKQVR